MDAFRRDVAYAFRSLLREPGFAFLAILTLALGIGANTAVFSILNALVLRPLPYPEPDRLVTLTAEGLDSGQLDDWRSAVPALEALEAYGLESAVVEGAGPARVVRALAVSDGFFDLLGGRAARGRLLEGPDGAGAESAAVVGPALWEGLGGGPVDADRVITWKGVSHPVTGVLPADFSFLRYRDVELWLPLPPDGRRVGVIGRLAPGATIEAVIAQADAFSRRLAGGDAAAETSVRVWPFGDVIYGDVRSPLLVLFGAGTLVLLIACVNVANLLLSRATGRTAELAVRTSLGASRRDLIRQLLTESGVLAVGGAVAGLVFAAWTADLISRLAPYTPRLEQVGVDATVLGFTMGVGMLCTLVAGLTPALGASRSATTPFAARGSTGTRRELRGRGLLVTLELALALIVLVGSGLLIRTFLVLRPSSPGFETADRIVARVTLPSSDPVAVSSFIDGLSDRIAALPGSPRTAAVTDLPLSGESAVIPVVEVDGRSLKRPLMLHFRAATPDYMEVIGMPIVRGRGLASSDRPDQPLVLVINENTARRIWPDDEPIGRTMAFDFGDGPVPFRVVGVSADASIFGGVTGSRPEAFASLSQSPWARMRLVIHAPVRPVAAERVRELAAAVDPRVAVEAFQTFDSLAAESVSLPRFQMALMTLFGALAFSLSVIGCYGVLAFAVARRRREIGIRMALGATRSAVTARVVRDGMRYILSGLAIGLMGAWASSRLLSSLLYGVAPTDVATFAIASSVLFMTAAVAAVVPARRAAAVRPAEVLHAD